MQMLRSQAPSDGYPKKVTVKAKQLVELGKKPREEITMQRNDIRIAQYFWSF